MEKGFLFKIREFFIDLLFPKFCLNCRKEGNYLCEDCFSLIEIADRQYCPFCFSLKQTIDSRTCDLCRKKKKLDGLFCPTSYENFIVKRLINSFKYRPYLKDLSKVLVQLMIIHLLKSNKIRFFSDFVLIPIPLHKKKLKERGYNQAEELAKELAFFLKIPLVKDVLIKTKNTFPQVELKKEQREKNVSNAFSVRRTNYNLSNKKILLIDDVFTTGATMEECAKILKENGAKEVWAMVIARG